MNQLKLFMVHCGFYDKEIYDVAYEFHVNIPIIADSLESAKAQIKKCPKFQARKMHIDGIHELSLINQDALNYRVKIEVETQSAQTEGVSL